MASHTSVFIAPFNLLIVSSSIVVESLNCPYVFQCIVESINTPTTHNNGYTSKFGANTTIVSSLNAACLGAFSCYRTCGDPNACNSVDKYVCICRFIQRHSFHPILSLQQTQQITHHINLHQTQL
eukprot:12072_1